MNISRRGFFVGLGASLAAPAIVRVTSIMPVRKPPLYLTLNDITCEAIKLFKNTNKFLQNIDAQCDDLFAATDVEIGDSLFIRLPHASWIENAAAYRIVHAAPHEHFPTNR